MHNQSHHQHPLANKDTMSIWLVWQNKMDLIKKNNNWSKELYQKQVWHRFTKRTSTSLQIHIEDKPPILSRTWRHLPPRTWAYDTTLLQTASLPFIQQIIKSCTPTSCRNISMQLIHFIKWAFQTLSLEKTLPVSLARHSFAFSAPSFQL